MSAGRSLVVQTMLALPQVWVSAPVILGSGEVLSPGVQKPLSHFMGADRVAIALAGARLADQDQCITAANVSPLAGQSRSTVGGKLKLMPRWFTEESTNCLDGGNPCPRGTKHYRIHIPS